MNLETSPLALSPALPSELLTYILSNQAYPTTLVICQARAAFLTSLLNSVSASHPAREPSFPLNESAETPSASASETTEALPAPTPESAPRHPLLIPILHQIATSRYISLVFIPTLSHLRAYLAAFPLQEKEVLAEHEFDQPGKNVPLLIVYGLVELHRDTSEWSAQGLGNSVSTLVEAGWRSERKVVMVEEKVVDRQHFELVDDTADNETEETGENEWKQLCKVWEQQVPILNGSVRRAGLESENGAWSGRTIEVGRIFARWFNFGRGDWHS